jgi:hypothetical protein
MLALDGRGVSIVMGSAVGESEQPAVTYSLTSRIIDVTVI